MSNVKKVIICILAIALVVLAIRTNVFAIEDLIILNNNSESENVIENIEDKSKNDISNVSNSNNSNNLNNSNNSVKNNNSTVSNASEHAEAGVDYSIIFIIAICGVSSVYAYKKIRDYNV